MLPSGPYHNFLFSLLGPNYQNYIPILNSIHVYCLQVVGFFVLLMINFVQQYEKRCENSFVDKVKLLRLKN
jgi:hypothetical protein